ncbi:MAG: hypothetical protein JXR94_02655 [Candidatus Hydrogenedentes bacterium]|nr:hypothetical protein [Candidatus Hydrogenedentota bacterium]
MERLTEERGDRTWRLFHIGWYVNLLAFLGVLAWAFWLVLQIGMARAEEQPVQVSDMIMMMGLFIIAAVLLMGAGISRYQARLEGQHLELKLAINALKDSVGRSKESAARPAE